MDQRDFNRDMNSYLKKRKDSGSRLRNVFKGVPKVQIVNDDEPAPPENVPLEQVQAVMRGEKVRPQQATVQETVFVTEEVRTETTASYDDFSDEPRTGFWTRLWASISMPKEQVVGLEEEDVDFTELTREKGKDEIDGDVKDMLKICVRWINKLPADEIQEIRRGDEYQEFKRLLEKYGLLKK